VILCTGSGECVYHIRRACRLVCLGEDMIIAEPAHTRVDGSLFKTSAKKQNGGGWNTQRTTMRLSLCSCCPFCSGSIQSVAGTIERTSPINFDSSNTVSSSIDVSGL